VVPQFPGIPLSRPGVPDEYESPQNGDLPMTMTRISRVATRVTWVLVMLANPVFAADSCEVTVGRLATLEGQVEVQRTGMASWRPGVLNGELCQGDTVRAGERSRATVVLVNQAVLRIDQNTAMRLDKISGVAEERSALSLFKGALQSFSRKPRGFEVSTPYLNGSIEGTEFVFRVEDGESILTVLEGTVVASNDQGSASVSDGESVAAAAGQAPQPRTLVRPRDAAQWSLYYPPILAAGGGDESAISPALRQAANDLSVGRVDEARARVDQAIADNDGAGLAYALRAVIVQNQREQALEDARQGVSLSPESAAAQIALSYALQANFQIKEARDVLQQAVGQHPDDALAQARLAELQLMLGDRRQATATAQQAAALEPDLGRTQITLGFAALAEFRNDEAAAAFEKAIALDSADPLPHLGLGLARISDGDLEAGRSEIELAVGLDSNDALLRSYLGKAYFEEKRTPLDFQQYDIAKQLDPLDPTAFLYSGIAKQTVNQPVEAIEDLAKSIELNDNRAVYRGRLLLDKDRAARGTSLSRVYNDLGFSQLGVVESSNSLILDPANASAHRFLSDTYRDVRRREISRVSELLQSQLMQDINTNPVQPSVSATNLNIVTAGGPASAGFSEFTPLFERNETQFNASGFGGNNDTSGGEVVVSSVFDRYSFSAGAFDYDTDGFRDNNDVDHKIYDFYAQAAVTPAVNIQAEYRHQETTNGALAMNFEPDAYDPSFNRNFKQNTSRFGLRFTPDVRQNLLFSAIYSDRDQDTVGGVYQTEQLIPLPPPIPPPFPPPPPTFIPVTSTSSQETTTDEKSHQYEAQHLFEGQGFNIVTGASYAKVEQEFSKTNSLAFDPTNSVVGAGNSNTFTYEPDIRDRRGYVYGNINLPGQITGTLGVSYDNYDEGLIDADRFNPKFGIQWDATDSLRVRGAWFEVVKPPLASNQTLEPTQIAGFNQYFDDTNATRSKRWGGAVDWDLSRKLFVGVEATKRDLETPQFSTDWTDVNFRDWDEWTRRAYAYWTPADRWGFSAEVAYDKWEGDATTWADPLTGPVVLHRARTLSYPVRAEYFHPSGFFAGVGITYVDQKVDRTQASVDTSDDSDFTVGDISIGYRFPRRMGIASLSVQNVTDQDFDYQDDSYREFQDEPSTGPYIPDRSIMARVTLNF